MERVDGPADVQALAEPVGQGGPRGDVQSGLLVTRPNRRDRILGFDGPYSGGRHQFIVRGDFVVSIPNPHGRDISFELLSRVLRQGGVSRKEGESV